MNDIRPGLRLINGTASVAKVELRIEPGEQVEVPEGSVIEQDRGPLSVVGSAPKVTPAPAEDEPTKAPARKAAAKK